MSTNLHNLKNKNKSKQFLTDMPTHQPNLNNSSIEASPLRCCAKLTRLTKIHSDRSYKDIFLHVCHVLGHIYQWHSLFCYCYSFLQIASFLLSCFRYPEMVLYIYMISRIPKWEKIHVIYFWVWLNLMISGCIHFPANDIISLWLNRTPMCV